MAFNRLSGSIIAPKYFGPKSGEAGTNVISGTLRGDGANILNVPRVTANAVNNYVLTVGASEYELNGEPNLIFNNSELTVLGDITASLNISASAFYGDGSKLTGINAGGGIFTTIDSSKAYTTSSLTVGSTDTPAHTMSIVGTSLLSGATDVAGHMIPTQADIYDLGSAAKPWRNLYISSSTIYFGTDALSVADNNLKFGSGSTTKGLDIGFMNFKNNGIFMDPGRLFKLGAYQIQMFGGIGYVRKVVIANYSIDERDYFIGINSADLDSSITLTLPAATGLLNGQTYVIKDEGGAVHTHPVTIICSGADTIDGQNSVVLESPYASIQLYSNGINKFYIF